jgi:hypothetical protein
VHPLRVHPDLVQQGGPGLRLVAVGVPGGEEAFVAPPDVELAPVDRVPRRHVGERGERCDPDRSAREHDRGPAGGGLDVDEAGDQTGRDGGRQGGRVAMDQDGGGHEAFPPGRAQVARQSA